ncbi:MAG: helix-turn-helix domain-containing protein [Limnohabitans sp.]
MVYTKNHIDISVLLRYFIGMKGHEITYLIKQSGHTVTQIAKYIGIKQPTVTQVIYGIRATPKVRKAIADAIGKPVSEIWPDNKTPPKEAIK